MFHTVTLRGRRGSLLWGAGNAAILAAWVVTRGEDRKWSLRANVERVDSFRIKQIPLLFQAIRESKPAGFWCWPVVPKTIAIHGPTLTAQLGPPER